MKLVVCLPLFVLATCGPKAAAPVTPPPPDNSEVGSDVPYASLFVASTRWRFTVASEHSMDGETTKGSSLAVCTVAKVGTFEGGQLSEIACDAGWPTDVGFDSVTGVWASTDRGLWRLDGWPTDDGAPTLADEAMIMAAVPAARTAERRDPDFEDPVGKTVIEQKGDSWCHSDATMMGDEAWSTICFGPGGITSGNMGWAGGSVHEATFTLAP